MLSLYIITLFDKLNIFIYVIFNIRVLIIFFLQKVKFIVLLKKWLIYIMKSMP